MVPSRRKHKNGRKSSECIPVLSPSVLLPIVSFSNEIGMACLASCLWNGAPILVALRGAAIVNLSALDAGLPKGSGETAFLRSILTEGHGACRSGS